MSTATVSLTTLSLNGKSASVSSGNSSRKARGFTTAPDRLCSPSADALSSTAICVSPSVPPASVSFWISRASSMAHASPAGPAPTMTTSISIASASGASVTIIRSRGSGGWWRTGRTVPRAASGMGSCRSGWFVRTLVKAAADNRGCRGGPQRAVGPHPGPHPARSSRPSPANCAGVRRCGSAKVRECEGAGVRKRPPSCRERRRAGDRGNRADCAGEGVYFDEPPAPRRPPRAVGFSPSPAERGPGGGGTSRARDGSCPGRIPNPRRPSPVLP